MRVAVLGGTGFLGRSVTEALRRAGHEVARWSRRTGYDLTTPAALSQLADHGYDTVVWAAGDPWRPTVELCTDAPIGVAEVCAVTGAHLVVLGTIHEYGFRAPGQQVFYESDPARPVSEYGRLKLQATRAVLDRLPDSCVLRLGNVCGLGIPGGSFLGAVIERAQATAATGQDLHWHFDNLQAQRDLVDIRDVAQAAVTAVGARAAGLINIGSGRCVTMREAVGLLAALADPRIEVLEEHPQAMDGGQAMAVDMARDALGWRPTHTLDETFESILNPEEQRSL
ncbi:hypothetical protein CGZ98_03570 [Enemella evansiae]|uniref:NAD-dependent epimerase/dehydratase family protein n=1 Tax=Enemella evansiae TaxID=2016499 RepID=UPI000B976D40|nr:NAD(P)-dependent oxidoreductase [Enemella evansiae]OYO15499.1 hypothetical protein CGZ98_03570 [Enemella evansiae]